MSAHDLSSLLERVKAASGPDRELDCAIAIAVDGFFIDGADYKGRPKYCYLDERGQNSPGQGHDMLVRCYTASLDAALALVERAKPAWAGLIHLSIAGSGQAAIEARDPCDDRTVQEFGHTPALALLAALLSALIAQGETA